MFSLLRPRLKHPSGIYNYHQGQKFSPGTQNFVFEPATGLPPHWVTGDRGRVTGSLRVTANTPLLWASQTVNPAGLGGLVAGQFAFQGLLTPDNENTTAV